MTLQVRCGDLGLACSGKVTAESPEELARKVGEHARDKHDVELTQTLVDYALAEAREA